MDQPRRNPLQIIAVLGLIGLGYLYVSGQQAAPARREEQPLKPGHRLVSVPRESYEHLLREFRGIDQKLADDIITLQKQADRARYDAAIRLGGADFLDRGDNH